jgi:hypothetical protein
MLLLSFVSLARFFAGAGGVRVLHLGIAYRGDSERFEILFLTAC